VQSGNFVTDSNGFLLLWHTLCSIIIDEFEKGVICIFYETMQFLVLKDRACREQSGQQLTKSSGVVSGNISGAAILFTIPYRNRIK
jgi:hypothetical protein